MAETANSIPDSDSEPSTEIRGPAPIPMEELNNRLRSLRRVIRLSGIDVKSDHATGHRTRAIAVANFALELANPLLLDKKNTKTLKNLREQVQHAATRIAEYDPDDLAKRLQLARRPRDTGSPGAIAALRQMYRQENLPRFIDDATTRDVTEATVWHVALNHSPRLQ